MRETTVCHLLIPHPVTMRTANITLNTDYGSQHFYAIETSSTNSYINGNWAVSLNGENATCVDAVTATALALRAPVDVKLSAAGAYIALNAEL